MTEPNQDSKRLEDLLNEIGEEGIDILKEIQRKGLTKDEAKHILNQLKQPEKPSGETLSLYEDSKNIRVGVISDTHYGSKFFDNQCHKDSIKMFNKYKVDMILHAGDVLEGMSNREGHVYELEDLGLTAQLDKAEKLMREYLQPIYFITGNHDEWAKKKSDQGMIIGDMIADKLENATFLGEYYANLQLGGDNGITIRLSHEGGLAYALSYSLQKRINALSGGTKPHAIFNGHLHKAIYMFYRNIHAFEAGTLQKQTPFMAMKGSPAHVGFWIVDFKWNKSGINELTQRFYPHYENSDLSKKEAYKITL